MSGSVARLCITALAALGLAWASAAGAASGSCGPRSLSQPFSAWHDPGHYFLVPNGGFESGTTSWSFAGGTTVVAGSLAAQATAAAAVPPGGWIETAPFCVDSDELTLRFFARNEAQAPSLLLVEARVTTQLLGFTIETWLPLGLVAGPMPSWQPSPPIIFGLSLDQLVGRQTTVAFRFVPVLAGAPWQIDDVFVDPFKDR